VYLKELIAIVIVEQNLSTARNSLHYRALIPDFYGTLVKIVAYLRKLVATIAG
jgi:hypothetical protein